MDITFSITGVQLLQFAVAVLLPLLVGLVTTRVTKSGAKAVLLLALSVITSLLTELLAAETFICFGPDTLAEARNRGYRPHTGSRAAATA